MSRRSLSPRRESQDGNDWMTTYSDAITLLLAFFVMLISVAQIDEGKFEQLKQGWGQASKGSQEESQTQQTELPLSIDGATIQKFEQRIEIEIANQHLYDTGSASLKANTLPLLESVAMELVALEKGGVLISVEGHTDDVPIQSDEFASNWELSATRATTVTRKLIEFGVNPKHIQAIGFADTRPKVGEAERFTPEQRQQNRRVVITIHQ